MAAKFKMARANGPGGGWPKNLPPPFWIWRPSCRGPFQMILGTRLTRTMFNWESLKALLCHVACLVNIESSVTLGLPRRAATEWEEYWERDWVSYNSSRALDRRGLELFKAFFHWMIVQIVGRIRTLYAVVRLKNSLQYPQSLRTLFCTTCCQHRCQTFAHACVL